MQSNLSQEQAATKKPGWHKLLALMLESLGLIKNLVELTGLELLVALQTIPKLIAIGMVLIRIAALTWISLSLSLSWLAFKIIGDIGAGFICFFLIQFTALIILLLAFRYHLSRVSLPNSRAQINNIAEVLHDAFTKSGTEENGRDK